MPGRDPSHWLHRLDAEEWLRAAVNELARAEEALLHKQQRPGVAGARRAAGMAWNAVLVGSEDAAYGRSYMDHLHALAADERVAELLRAEVDSVNQRFARIEQIKRFAILDHELTQAAGELTPTMKIKRAAVYDIHAETVERLYDRQPADAAGAGGQAA